MSAEGMHQSWPDLDVSYFRYHWLLKLLKLYLLWSKLPSRVLNSPVRRAGGSLQFSLGCQPATLMAARRSARRAASSLPLLTAPIPRPLLAGTK